MNNKIFTKISIFLFFTYLLANFYKIKSISSISFGLIAITSIGLLSYHAFFRKIYSFKALLIYTIFIAYIFAYLYLGSPSKSYNLILLNLIKLCLNLGGLYFCIKILFGILGKKEALYFFILTLVIKVCVYLSLSNFFAFYIKAVSPLIILVNFLDILLIILFGLLASFNKDKQLNKSLWLIFFILFSLALTSPLATTSQLYPSLIIVYPLSLILAIVLMIYLFDLELDFLSYDIYKLKYENNFYKTLASNIQIKFIIALPILMCVFGFLDLLNLLIIILLALSYPYIILFLNKTPFNKPLGKEHGLLLDSIDDFINFKLKNRSSENGFQLFDEARDLETGLYNKDFLLKELTSYNKMAFFEYSLIFIDISEYKKITQLHNEKIAKNLLEQIIGRIKDLDIKDLRLARVSHIELAIILPSNDKNPIENFVIYLLDNLREAYFVYDYVFNINFSIGIVVGSPQFDATSIFRYAELSMYNAKASKHSYKYVFYSPKYSNDLIIHSQIEKMLNTADFDKDFEIFYQPQFDLEDKSLIGMEAFVRWNHNVFGFIAPNDFMPIAEESGIIVSLNEWIFKKAMLQIKEWNESYSASYQISINTSPITFTYIHFFDYLVSLIEDFDLNPSWIEFDIIEEKTMSLLNNFNDVFEKINQLNFNVSLKDFGLGYTALSYIKKFNFKRIKISKELISSIDKDPKTLPIVKTIITMAHALDINLIAEGVESKNQAISLKNIGCKQVQGYYFGKPVPKDIFEEKYLKVSNFEKILGL